METFRRQRPPYLISDDKTLLDLDVVHGYLTRSYWAEGIGKPRVQRTIEHSFCFGLYVEENAPRGRAELVAGEGLEPRENRPLEGRVDEVLTAPSGTMPSLRQIGFARVLSDLSAIAYLMDVFVLEEYRGEGLGKWIVESVLDCPEFAPVRRWILATKDAHDLYTRYGFTPLDHPEFYLHRYVPDMYVREEGAPA